MQSYTAPKDAAKVFTRVKSATSFGTGGVLGTVTAQNDDEYFTCGAAVKRPMCKFSTSIRKQRKIIIEDFMVMASPTEIGAELRNGSISPQALAEYYLERLPKPTVETESEMLDLLVKQFHPYFVGPQGIEAYHTLVGSFVLPFMVNDDGGEGMQVQCP